MDAEGTLERELKTVESILAQLEHAENNARFLVTKDVDERTARALVHDLASRALGLKRVVKNLSRFDDAVRDFSRDKRRIRTSTKFHKRFDRELELTGRNEREALRELHAAAAVLHDMTRDGLDEQSVKVGAHALVKEFEKLRAILESIRTHIRGEMILFDHA